MNFHCFGKVPRGVPALRTSPAWCELMMRGDADGLTTLKSWRAGGAESWEAVGGWIVTGVSLERRRVADSGCGDRRRELERLTSWRSGWRSGRVSRCRAVASGREMLTMENHGKPTWLLSFRIPMNFHCFGNVPEASPPSGPLPLLRVDDEWGCGWAGDVEELEGRANGELGSWGGWIVTEVGSLERRRVAGPGCGDRRCELERFASRRS